jgi:hypothetical protein
MLSSPPLFPKRKTFGAQRGLMVRDKGYAPPTAGADFNDKKHTVRFDRITYRHDLFTAPPHV